MSKYIGSNLLLVEDEESLAVGLKYNLQEDGYAVTHVTDGKQALEQAKNTVFDLVVLDLMLPYIDGFEVARRIRESDPQLPILMLTARSSTKDRVRGLEAGADDYMTKPFHLEEFLLRVRGMLRRKSWYRELIEIDRIYDKGNLHIDFGDLTGSMGSHQFTMTALEAALFRYLVQNEGRVVQREELLEHVWGIAAGVETRTVENFIVRLRKHIEENPAKPQYIRTIRGAGYVFSIEA